MQGNSSSSRIGFCLHASQNAASEVVKKIRWLFVGTTRAANARSSLSNTFNNSLTSPSENKFSSVMAERIRRSAIGFENIRIGKKSGENGNFKYSEPGQKNIVELAQCYHEGAPIIFEINNKTELNGFLSLFSTLKYLKSSSQVDNKNIPIFFLDKEAKPDDKSSSKLETLKDYLERGESGLFDAVNTRLVSNMKDVETFMRKSKIKTVKPTKLPPLGLIERLEAQDNKRLQVHRAKVISIEDMLKYCKNKTSWFIGIDGRNPLDENGIKFASAAARAVAEASTTKGPNAVIMGGCGSLTGRMQKDGTPGEQVGMGQMAELLAAGCPNTTILECDFDLADSLEFAQENPDKVHLVSFDRGDYAGRAAVMMEAAQNYLFGPGGSGVLMEIESAMKNMAGLDRKEDKKLFIHKDFEPAARQLMASYAENGVRFQEGFNIFFVDENDVGSKLLNAN